MIHNMRSSVSVELSIFRFAYSLIAYSLHDIRDESRDILTKALPRPTFKRLRKRCLGDKIGNYFVHDEADSERIMYMYDLDTWMTQSVYYMTEEEV